VCVCPGVWVCSQCAALWVGVMLHISIIDPHQKDIGLSVLTHLKRHINVNVSAMQGILSLV
jgi:hypothetical protein